MSSKDDKSKKEIEKLVEIHRTLTKQYHEKKELIEKLALEISELKEVLNQVNKMIAGKSFTTASTLLDAEKIFRESIGTTGKGTSIKRKLFSKENELLCVLRFSDLKDVEIKIVNPEKAMVKETSEIFINSFIEKILVKIKEQQPALERIIDKYEDTDFIERIFIKNVNKLENFDLIAIGIGNILDSTEDFD